MNKNIFKLTGTKLGILITIFILFLNGSGVDFLDQIELKALDERFIKRGPVKAYSPIVIVGIDDNSIKKYGRWPWPRWRIAEMVDFFTEADAKVVGFDITFSEEDKNSELEFIKGLIKDIDTGENVKEWGEFGAGFKEDLKSMRDNADNDKRLAEAIKKNGRVILGFFFHTQESKQNLSFEVQLDMTKKYPLISRSKLGAIIYDPPELVDYQIFDAYTAADVNIKQLSDAANGFGYFNIFPDIDGTVRWAPMVLEYQGIYEDGDPVIGNFPPLALQILREYLRPEGDENEEISVFIDKYGVNEISVYGYMIPTNEYGLMMINFRGPGGTDETGKGKTFEYISAVDIFEGSVDKKKFKNKMVIVGATAIGIYDMRVTPFSEVFPGVEIHANIIDSILSESVMDIPPWANDFDKLIIVLLGLVISLIIPRYKASRSAFIILMISAAYVMFNFYMFSVGNVWLNITYPMLTIAVTSLCLYTYRFATEEREKKVIRGVFSQYVSESVVNEVLKDPDKLQLGGVKKELTVLFSDIRSFTTISEGLQPTELVHLLNEYLSAMTELVFQHGGTLDKYMGDAVMAFYGAPLDFSDHALKACHTALNMMRKLKKMQALWARQKMPKLDIGIGLNTGPMSVGNMGSKFFIDYTVMGDNVNLGSRLEGINKQYGTNIIISEYTYAHVKEEMICRQLDLVQVKGKNLPVKIYELLGDVRFEEAKAENRRLKASRAAAKKHKFRRFEDQTLPERRDPKAKSFFELRDRFETALNKFFAMKFEESIKILNELAKDYPKDKPTRVFIKRAEAYLAEPPPADWDGVYVMTTK